MTRPVPLRFDALPAATCEALSRSGHGAEWFDACDPVLQLTVVNLHVKLRALGLWRFVARESASGPGCLHFETDDLDGLKAALRAEPWMSNPADTRDGYWQSRELRASCALHLKHFDGWPTDRIQAHIDHSGLWLRWWWWLLPAVPLMQLVRHALGYHSYRDVAGVRRLLERQGLWP